MSESVPCSCCKEIIDSFCDDVTSFMASNQCVSCENYFCESCFEKIYSPNFDFEMICKNCFKISSNNYFINEFLWQCYNYGGTYYVCIEDRKEFLIDCLNKLILINEDDVSFINKISSIIKFIKDYDFSNDL